MSKPLPKKFPNTTECAEWYHLWNISGYCVRCGKRMEPESESSPREEE